MRKRYTKYHAKKCVYDGITFDSKHECERYKTLKAMQERGEISDLQLQVKVELIPAQREPSTVGKRGGLIQGKCIERAVEYRADFVYTKDGNTVYEDAKGMKTKEYILKRKMLLFLKNIRLLET